MTWINPSGTEVISTLVVAMGVAHAAILTPRLAVALESSWRPVLNFFLERGIASAGRRHPARQPG